MTSVAVVIASRDRPEQLRTCLDALMRLAQPADEIVVVDDGSATPLAPVCAAFPRVRCIRRRNGGPGAARNEGVRATRAELVAFTDDDCHPRPDWLAELAATHAGDPLRLVGGRVENALPENPYASAAQSNCSHLYEHFGAEKGNAPFFTTNNMLFSRKTFERVGGFDESYSFASEDRDLGLRWRAAGGSLVYAPKAIVDHAHPLDLRRFLRQQASYGRGARRLHLSLDHRGDRRPKLEALDFYWRLVTRPLRTGGRRPVTQAALVVLSQLAMIGGYLQEVGAGRARRTGGGDGPAP